MSTEKYRKPKVGDRVWLEDEGKHRHYEIRDDLPMPEKQTGRHPKLAGPFSKLEVGQGYAFPLKRRNVVSSNARTWGEKRGRRFATRKLDADTCGIWRVE